VGEVFAGVLLRSPKRRTLRTREDNINLQHGEIGIDGANRICLAKDLVQCRPLLI
jgi:hypothetical protein